MEYSNLPLNTILEVASKLNKLEERINQLYNSVNLVLEEVIDVTRKNEFLKNDTISQLLEIYNEIDNIKKNS